jgi:hypothetical protein
LGTTIKYLLGAADIGLGTTIKYLRRTASGAAEAAWAKRSSTCDAQREAPRAKAGRNDQVPATLNERRCGQWPAQNDQVPAMRNERHREKRLGATCDAQRAAPRAPRVSALAPTTKYLRRMTRAAAGRGLGTSIKYFHHIKAGQEL